MTLLPEISYTLPAFKILGKKHEAEVLSDPVFQEASKAFVESRFAVLKFVLPPELKIANELFFVGILTDLLRELEQKENGLVAYEPFDSGEAMFVIRQGIYGILNHRIKIDRPVGFVNPLGEVVETKLLANTRHNISGVGMVYHGSGLGGPVHPTNYVSDIPTMQMIARKVKKLNA